MHRVWFASAHRAVEAEHGENLLSLARRCGVHIDSSCGGNGSCHQCRVSIDAPEHFCDAQSRPIAPQHKRDGKPIWLACRGGVCGPISVQAAPLHATGGALSPSLLGWQIAPGGKSGRLQVFDPASSAALVIELGSGKVVSESQAEGGDIEIGRELGRAEALAAGAGLPQPVSVIDLAGVVVLADVAGTRAETVDASALASGIRHDDGAIYWVEWSPLKTRTVIETWNNVAPVGLSTGGVIATVAALLQAGMIDPDGTLRDSRFVRTGPAGREVVLVGPRMEAVTAGGAVWLTAHDVTLTQTRIQAVLDALARLRVAASALGRDTARQVLTGPPGVALNETQMQWLGFKNAAFIPNAALLGAARWAASRA